jgi:hypothetical protein
MRGGVDEFCLALELDGGPLGIADHVEGTVGTDCCLEISCRLLVMVVPLWIEATDESEVIRRSLTGRLTCRVAEKEEDTMSGLELDLVGWA